MKIQWYEECPDHSIMINSGTFPQSLRNNKIVTIYIGGLSKDLGIVTDDNLPKDVLILPTGMRDSYSIPQELEYEVRYEDSSIVLGPIILLIAPEYYKEISKEFLTYCEAHLQQYSQIKGLIYVCLSSDIDIKTENIYGYCYIPSKEGPRWIKGTFPYPQAVFNRTKILPPLLYSSLEKSLGGNRIFNNGFISKWNQYKLFSTNTILQKHLPETQNFNSIKGLHYMLYKYESVYLKPHNLANGLGIFLIKKAVEGYEIKDSINNTLQFPTIRKTLAYFLEHRISKKYIIQQPVPYRYNNRNVDFRFYMQKNKNRIWTTPGFSAKVSIEDSINTNYQNREVLLNGEKALKHLYGFNRIKIKKKAIEMFSICKEACETVEKEGIHLGDVAFDLIMDQNHNIWIVELQIRYGRERSLSKKTYYRNMVTPIAYAKALAGF